MERGDDEFAHVCPVCLGNENDAWVDGHWSGMCFVCGQMWMEERVEEWNGFCLQADVLRWLQHGRRNGSALLAGRCSAVVATRSKEWQCSACRQMFCGGCNTVERMGRIDNCRYRTREDTG